MADFITTNAVPLVTTLAAVLLGCVILMSWLVAKRTRQRQAVQALLELTATEGRYACDAIASLLAHDLNNLILVLSMESERLEAESMPELNQQADMLRQLVTEGREVVERCNSHKVLTSASSSALCDELRVAADLVSNAGIGDVDLATARSVPIAATVPRPAVDVHLLVLALVRVALGDEGAGRRLTLTVSTGRDGALPVDANEDDWISVSVLGEEALAKDDPRVTGLVRAAQRLSGEVALPDRRGARRRLAVSLPIDEG